MMLSKSEYISLELAKTIIKVKPELLDNDNVDEETFGIYIKSALSVYMATHTAVRNGGK